MSNLYNTIQKLCIDKNITPSNLCGQLGLSKSTLSNLKNGRAETLSGTTTLKIANYFGITVNDLMEGTIAGKSTEIIPMPSAPKLSEEEKAFVDILKQLNFAARKKLMEYAEDLMQLPKYQKESL